MLLYRIIIVLLNRVNIINTEYTKLLSANSSRESSRVRVQIDCNVDE